MILEGIAASLLWKSVTGFIGNVLNVVGAVVSPIFNSFVKMLQKIKVTVDGVIILCIVLGCLAAGWIIARHAEATGRESERAAIALAQRKIKGQLAIFVRMKKGEISEEKARLDGLDDEMRRILASLPPEIVTKIEPAAPTESTIIKMPVLFPWAKGKTDPATTKGKSQPSAQPGDFQPDYPVEVRDTLNKINIRK